MIDGMSDRSEPDAQKGGRSLPSLSAELRELADEFSEQEVSIQRVFDRLESRVYTLFMVLLCIPFCQPIPLPGLSTPFGVILLLLGFYFGLDKHPWIPRRLGALVLPKKFWPAVLRAGSKLLSWIERILRPRLQFLFRLKLTRFLAGTVIMLSGALLLLPMAVPITNTLPAITIILLAVAFPEEDGWMLVLGFVCFLVTVAFFILLFVVGVEVFVWLLNWIRESVESYSTITHFMIKVQPWSEQL